MAPLIAKKYPYCHSHAPIYYTFLPKEARYVHHHLGPTMPLSHYSNNSISATRVLHHVMSCDSHMTHSSSLRFPLPTQAEKFKQPSPPPQTNSKSRSWRNSSTALRCSWADFDDRAKLPRLIIICSDSLGYHTQWKMADFSVNTHTNTKQH